MKAKPVFSPYAGIAIAVLAVSTASLFIRLAQKEASSLVIAAARMTIAAIVIAPVTLITKWKEVRSLSRRAWLLILLSGIFLVLHFASWITSLEMTSIASSVVLVTTAPLWVALVSPLILRERMTKFVLIGMAVALVGGVIVGISDLCLISAGRIACSLPRDFFSSKAVLGNGLALAGAIFSAGYLIIGRLVRKQVSLTVYISLVYSISSVILISIALLNGQRFTGFRPETYLYFVCLGLIPQLIGHSVYNWSLKYVSAAFVSISLLGEPIGTVILAFLVLKEKPTTLEIVGGLLILVGIFISARVANRKGVQFSETET